MTLTPSWNRSERGDTLIEILVALLIISTAVIALLGGLVTSASTSATHRNLATLDNVLRSFGASTTEAVSGQPGSGPGAAPLFARCARGYQIAGALYPAAQDVGGPVSVPVMGLAESSPITATVGGATVRAGTTSTSGAAVATFAVPSLPAGSYPVAISDGTTTIPAGTLTVTTTGGTDELGGTYTLDADLLYWNGSGFGTACAPTSTDADVQQLTLTLSDTQVNDGATDRETLLLSNTDSLPVPSETISDSVASPQPLGTPITFTAHLDSNTPLPTGQVTWTFPGSPSGTACAGANPSTLGNGTASCTISDPPAGSYTAAGAYSGDGSWSGSSSEALTAAGVPADTVVIQKGTASQITVTTAGPNSPAQIGSTLDFTATVSGVPGITPTGQVTWTFPPGTPAGAACAGGDTATLTDGTASCSVSPALPGTYQPTATYSGDNNYVGGESGDNWSVTVSTPAASQTSVSPAGTSTAVTGTNITFTATVSGVPGLTPTGTVAWSFPPGTPAGASCSNLTKDSGTLSNGAISCTVTKAPAGTYNPTASYQGSPYYSASSGSQSTIVVGKETPTVSVTSQVRVTNGRSGHDSLTFTATVTPDFPSDPTPTGSITAWNVTGGATSCTSTTPLAAVQGTNTAAATCTVSPSSATSTYSVQPAYSGDGSYNAASGSGSSSG